MIKLSNFNADLMSSSPYRVGRPLVAPKPTEISVKSAEYSAAQSEERAVVTALREFKRLAEPPSTHPMPQTYSRAHETYMDVAHFDGQSSFLSIFA